MKKEDYNLIETYLNGELNEADALLFQQRLKKDASFLEAYELRKSMFLLLKNKKGKADLKQKLEQLGNKHLSEKKEEKRVFLRSKWLRYVAAVAAVFVLAFAIYSAIPPESLYDKYAETVAMDMLEKGKSKSLDEAEIAFDASSYESAYLSLKKYLKEDPENSIVLYYLGISALELNKTEEALAIFKTIEKSPSYYNKEAKWYQALTYLKAEKFTKCKEVLKTIPESNEWYEKAQALSVEVEKIQIKNLRKK